jgi:hypothetical protein
MENIDPETLKRLEADIITTHREDTARRAEERQKQRRLQVQAQVDMAKNLTMLVEEFRQIRIALMALARSKSNAPVSSR